jgi:hypothetical protein
VRQVAITAVLAVLAVCGCDAVFGLHDRHAGDAAGGDGAGPDGPSGPTALATIVEVTIPNGSNDAPEAAQTRALGSDRVTATATLDDGTAVTPRFTADGDLAIPLHATGGGYALSLVIDDDVPRVFVSSAAHLTIADELVGRTRTAIEQATPLTITAGGGYQFANGDTVFVDSTGIWSSSLPTSGLVSNSTVFGLNWGSASTLSGPIGALDGTLDDTLALAVTHDTNDGYTAIQNFGTTTAIEMTDGQPSQATIAVASTNPLPSTCFTLTADISSPLVRLGSDYGSDGNPTPASDWIVTASGGATFSATVGLPLAVSTMSANAHGVKLVNPFAGTSTTISLGGELTGALAIPGRTPLSLGPSLRVFDAVTASPGCASSPALTLDITGIALPSHASIGGVTPTTQGQSLTLDPAVGQPVAWTALDSGRVDAYQSVLFELVPGAASAESLVERIRFVTTGTTVTIPPGVLEAGHFYTVEVIALSGLPGAASGDFETSVLPLGFASSVTPAFLVEPP